jgi:hypothetical protein
VRIAAGVIGLPNLDQRVRRNVPFAVEDAALNADARAGHAGLGQRRGEDLARAIATLR